MTAEVVSIGTVAISVIGLTTFVLRKHFEYSEKMRETLDENTQAIRTHAQATKNNGEVLTELKKYLYRVNGKN